MAGFAGNFSALPQPAAQSGAGFTGDFSPAGAPAGSTEQPAGGFFAGLADNLKATAAKLKTNITDPHLPNGDFIRQWGKDSQGLLDAAKASADEGNYENAAVHTLNFLLNAVPGLGKKIDDSAQALGAANDLYDKDPEAGHDAANRVLGDLVGTFGAPQLIPPILKGAGAAVKGAASVATKPGVLKAVGAGVGAMAGHATGIPGGGLAGAYVGREAGGALSDIVNAPPAEAPAAAPPAPTPQATTIQQPEASITPAAAAPAEPPLDTSQIKLEGIPFAKLNPKLQADVLATLKANPGLAARSPETPAVATNGLPDRPPPTPSATVEPPGAAGQQIDQLLRKLQGKMADKGMIGHPDEYKLGQLNTPGELARFNDDAPIIDSAKRKPASTAAVANPTMISNPAGARAAQAIIDDIAKASPDGSVKLSDLRASPEYLDLLKKNPKAAKAAIALAEEMKK